MDYREAINYFWDSFGGTKNTGEKYSFAKKIAILKELADVKLNWRRRNERAKFEKVKFHRHSLKSHEKCFACLKKADVRHHIIQLQHGGINAKKNIVSLCHTCHALIHPWLRQ